jgi:hypothetical protein
MGSATPSGFGTSSQLVGELRFSDLPDPLPATEAHKPLSDGAQLMEEVSGLAPSPSSRLPRSLLQAGGRELHGGEWPQASRALEMA